MNFIAYTNPYSHQNFFSFFGIFLNRMIQFFSGKLNSSDLASDEIQIIVLCGVAISCALVGTFLVLRRMTMLANALSHTILIGIVIAYLLMMAFGNFENPQEALNLKVLLIAALFTGVLTTFFTEFLTKGIQLQEDASIGIVFTTFFALGIILITLFTRNVHIGTELVMGNVDALTRKDISSVYWIVLLNAVAIFLFFKEFKITTFDPGLSRASGISPLFYNYFLMILTSAAAISGFKAVGVLMILAFLVGPVLIARFFTHSLIILIVLSMIIGCAASLIGVAFSRHILTIRGIGLSTGGLVVCTIVFLFILAALFSPNQGIIASYFHRKSLKKQLKLGK